MEALYYSFLKDIAATLNHYGILLGFSIFLAGTLYSYITWSSSLKTFFNTQEQSVQDYIKEEYKIELPAHPTTDQKKDPQFTKLPLATALLSSLGAISLLSFTAFVSGLPEAICVPLGLALVFAQRIIWLDSTQQLIYNIDNYGFLLAGFIFAALYPNTNHLYDSLIAAIAMALFLIVVVGGYQLIRKQEGFGEGDIVLLFGIIPFLGWYTFSYVFLTACITTLIWAFFAKLFKGREGAISFGPGLMIGWAVGLFLVFYGVTL